VLGREVCPSALNSYFRLRKVEKATTKKGFRNNPIRKFETRTNSRGGLDQ